VPFRLEPRGEERFVACGDGGAHEREPVPVLGHVTMMGVAVADGVSDRQSRVAIKTTHLCEELHYVQKHGLVIGQDLA